ncbi:DNA cytosine methyltransferase [Microvirga roseola]|uniref:DNA cytosine methyltransferase n=1 Tax=Microvirga roseola TaxID=2883126 RepID=UPI001E628DF2|nr:DNA cytosine methyltransferase [Microvirga roseola]
MYQPSEEFSFDPEYPEGLTKVGIPCLTRAQVHAIRVYDFFSGCGGTSAGLQNAGMVPIVALDMDGEALETFRLNFPDAHAIKSDIRTVLTRDLEPYFERQRTVPILFSACAPCQPFSKQNRQKKEADARISLLTELTRFLERFRPELLFVENVPGLQEFSEDEDGPLHDLVTVLDRLGYWHTARVILAQDYGVPQNRRRLVLVASAFGPIDLPEQTHGPGRAPYRTVWDAIGHLPHLEAGESDTSVPNHYACKLSPLNLERIRAVGEGGGRLAWDERLQLDCHRTVKGYSDVYGRMSWGKPSPALTTRCISLSNGRFGHPEQDRAISIREAACIQTFPKDFIFVGTVNGMARQIGNAVPPDLATSIGKALIEHVDKYWSNTDG